LDFKHFDKFSELPIARSLPYVIDRCYILLIVVVLLFTFFGIEFSWGKGFFGGGEIRHHTLLLVGLKSHIRSFLSIDEIKIIMETNVPAHTSQRGFSRDVESAPDPAEVLGSSGH